MHGIIPILYAFFQSDGALDRDAMRAQVQAICAQGPPALAVLGLATEVGKLTPDERASVIDWTAQDRDPDCPLVVTIAGDTVAQQRALARHAIARGARALILQPPSRRGEPESFYFDFFAEVMDGLPVDVGIQNAPEYLGVGLGPTALRRLAGQCANFRLLKGEGPATVIRETILALDGLMPVLNGRGGLELVDNLRAGCAGMIVAPEAFDAQSRVYSCFSRGDETGAEAAYREVLPLIVFVMQSLDTMLCYGKRIAALRLGIGPVHDRDPAMAPTVFGLACAERFARALGPFDPTSGSRRSP